MRNINYTLIIYDMIDSHLFSTAAVGGNSKRQIVHRTAESLRGLIYGQPANTQIGSLPELARKFEVGIVTVQQAARILEHEGLLEVRRGPGGGYYGRRPALADLERVLSAYMRSETASWREVLDMTSLLFNRLCSVAARCTDERLHAELRRVADRICACDDAGQIGVLEAALQDTLFRMVDQPLFELLTRVALGTARSTTTPASLEGTFGLERWREGRWKITEAILRKDPELAHFEADRQNRKVLVAICGLDEQAA